MALDIFSATGQKNGSMELPADLFKATVNYGLMHQAVLMQQGNRRASIAHAKTRADVLGSTKKMFAQKHTGNARRGPSRSPVLRGGGKAFGPRNSVNHERAMPRKMRHAAIRSCLSLQAEKGNIVLLEGYPDNAIKTKTLAELLKKLPIEHGRSLLLVTPEAHSSLQKSSRNIPRVTTITAAYLNPEAMLHARKIIFLVDAVKVAQELFGDAKVAKVKTKKHTEPKTVTKKAGPRGKKMMKDASAKAPSTKKTSSKKSADSSAS